METKSNEFYLKGYYLIQQLIIRLDQINKYAQSIRDTVTPEESYRVICRLNVLLRDLADNEAHDEDLDEEPNEIQTETNIETKPQI